METTNSKVGGYVRILKDGNYEGVSYKKDEIWQILRKHTSRVYHVEREGNRTVVIVDNNESQYGNESTYIGMDNPNEQQTYNIY